MNGVHPGERRSHPYRHMLLRIFNEVESLNGESVPDASQCYRIQILRPFIGQGTIESGGLPWKWS
jgi:hypothetical protein